MKKIGDIDVSKYYCVTDNIITNEVILTRIQKKHIKKRHKKDYRKVKKHLQEIVTNPDYILEANKPYTAVILKRINNKRVKLILRLITPNDDKKYKNSIITLMTVDEQRWNRYLKAKKILYKAK